MKTLKQIINSAKLLVESHGQELHQVLWQLICYSPKMPVRFQQQELLNEAEKFQLSVFDEHFAKRELVFNVFKWGTGKKKILLTHGWGSKASDFSELITLLKLNRDVQIIAFDAPGNGSSEGELSNLLLYVQSVKAIILKFGIPDVMIGHSLGAMANILALKEAERKPSLLISLAPLIKLKENFEASLNMVEAPKEAQNAFFESFNRLFNISAGDFNLIDIYSFDSQVRHWVGYGSEDKIHPYQYLEEFLGSHPLVESKCYEELGHDKILRDPQVINDICHQVGKII